MIKIIDERLATELAVTSKFNNDKNIAKNIPLIVRKFFCRYFFCKNNLEIKKTNPTVKKTSATEPKGRKKKRLI